MIFKCGMYQKVTGLQINTKYLDVPHSRGYKTINSTSPTLGHPEKKFVSCPAGG